MELLAGPLPRLFRQQTSLQLVINVELIVLVYLLVLSLIELCVFVPLSVHVVPSLLILAVSPHFFIKQPLSLFLVFLVIIVCILFVSLLHIVELLPDDEATRAAAAFGARMSLVVAAAVLRLVLLWCIKHLNPVFLVLVVEFRILKVENLVEIVQECHCNENCCEAHKSFLELQYFY